MSTEQFLEIAGRPTVRVQRRYPHPIDKVWRAVTTPEHLGKWFPSPVQFELRVGGEMRFGAFGDSVDAAGRIEAVDAPYRLEFTWGNDTMTFVLVADGDGTLFTLTHTFDDRFGAPSFATGWGLCLSGLRALLADEPLPAASFGVARHEELVHEFGLDTPEVTQSNRGWTVRVERQLTCPATVAWDLWFGSDVVSGAQRSAPRVGEPMTPYQAPDRVIGVVTEVEEHRLLAFDITPDGGPGDHLRLEFTNGTGHGVRIVLIVTGTDAAERDAAAQMWGTNAIGHLARCAAEWATLQSPLSS
ncbi:MAG: SRPBCC domain-containing protein [Acidimicrobiia bacterium]